MSQIQVVGARVNRTVFLLGRILSPGYYSYDDGRLSQKEIKSMMEYVARQKRMPPESRDNPPIYHLDIVPLDQPKNVGADEISQVNKQPDVEPIDYSAKSLKELKELCKKRNIEFTKSSKVEDLAQALKEYDEALMSWTKRFKDLNEFQPLSDEEKLSYLDSIFDPPEGIDADSDEYREYVADLTHAVTIYSGQSQSDEVNNKLREILEHYEES